MGYKHSCQDYDCALCQRFGKLGGRQTNTGSVFMNHLYGIL